MPRTQHLKLQMQEEETRQMRPAFQKDRFDPPQEAAFPEHRMEAAYPGDAEEIDQIQEEWAAYPDMVYEAQLQQKKRSQRRAIPIHPYSSEEEAEEKPPANTPLWAAVGLVCFLLLAALVMMVNRWHQDYMPFRQKVSIVNRDTIAQGVLVDGVHVGGMTRSQAEKALDRQIKQDAGELRMAVQVDGQTWIMTPNELPFVRNTKTVLDTAYAVGRQGSVETIATGVTPFEYRYQHLYHTVATHVALHTEVTYDPATVRKLVGIIEANINRDAIDSQVATFDFNSRSFTFTEDRAGARLDGEKLYNRIIDALNRKDLQATITAASETIAPRVTRSELMNTFSLVSTYTTETTSDSNRNNNINLAAHAVSGTVVMPGETFSFNQTTGQRTTEKGYLPAAAIAGGTTVDEIGGGVCQVSSTLFNAAAMADMTILERSPHAWPSNYVDKGRDATVNWPNLDFTFRNDKETPIFIVAWYSQRLCTVEIYGATMGAESIELATQLVATTDPPAEAEYVQNEALEPGTQQVKKKARTGYYVETYKVFKRNGREVGRNLLCTSDYPMIQELIEYN